MKAAVEGLGSTTSWFGSIARSSLYICLATALASLKRPFCTSHTAVSGTSWRSSRMISAGTAPSPSTTRHTH